MIDRLNRSSNTTKCRQIVREKRTQSSNAVVRVRSSSYVRTISICTYNTYYHSTYSMYFSNTPELELKFLYIYIRDFACIIY